MRSDVEPRQRKDGLMTWAMGRTSVVARRADVRVFIANSHDVVRAGVRTFLQRERGLVVVSETGRVEDVLSESCRTRPDVVVLEWRPSRGWGSDLCKELMTTIPALRIIRFFTGAGDDGPTRNSVEGGIHGYLPKDVRRREFARAIRTVANGGFYFGRIGANHKGPVKGPALDAVGYRFGLQGLSPQERRIIALMAQGNTNREIAVSLELSEKTVKNYVANMFTKLDIARRTQAVVLYLHAQRASLSSAMPIPGCERGGEAQPHVL